MLPRIEKNRKEKRVYSGPDVSLANGRKLLKGQSICDYLKGQSSVYSCRHSRKRRGWDESAPISYPILSLTANEKLLSLPLCIDLLSALLLDGVECGRVRRCEVWQSSLAQVCRFLPSSFPDGRPVPNMNCLGKFSAGAISTVFALAQACIDSSKKRVVIVKR